MQNVSQFVCSARRVWDVALSEPTSTSFAGIRYRTAVLLFGKKRGWLKGDEYIIVPGEVRTQNTFRILEQVKRRGVHNLYKLKRIWALYA